MKKIYKQVILLIIIGIVFFSFNLIITYDGANYLKLSNILSGDLSWSKWLDVRGIVYPFMLFLSKKIFTDTSIGFLISSFLTFILSIYLIEYLCNKVFKNKIIKVLLIILCMFNTIIFGYYHVLLTESYAITLTLLVLVLSIKWLDDKSNKLLYPILFSILTIFIWHLKQTYITIIILPVLTVTIISLIRKHNLKNFIYRLGTLCLCLISLIVSIKLWNSYLLSKNNKLDAKSSIEEKRTSNSQDSYSLLNKYILEGADIVVMDKFILTKENLDIYGYVSDEVKEKIVSKVEEGKRYYLVNITDHEHNTFDQDVILTSTGISGSILELLNVYYHHPLKITTNYLVNYCALSSLCYYKYHYEDGTYTVSTKLHLLYSKENYGISHYIYVNNDTNIMDKDDTLYEYVEKYDSPVNPGIISYIFRIFEIYPNVTYKLCFVILPFLWIYLLVKIIKNKKNNILDISFILITFAFGHAVFMALIGGIIDRYGIESYIPFILGLSFTIYYIYVSKRRVKK